MCRGTGEGTGTACKGTCEGVGGIVKGLGGLGKGKQCLGEGGGEVEIGEVIGLTCDERGGGIVKRCEDLGKR